MTCEADFTATKNVDGATPLEKVTKLNKAVYVNLQLVTPRSPAVTQVMKVVLGCLTALRTARAEKGMLAAGQPMHKTLPTFKF